MRRSRISTPAAILAALLCASSIQAETTSESDKIARRRFAEGVTAADAGNYEAARVAFQQAYALRPHPSVLHNLGRSELKTAHYLEAARHLATFIRDTTFGTPAERDAAKKALMQAEAKLSKLLVEVDVDGSEITVDGEPTGRSPMGPDPAYVEPGNRVVHVQKEGYQPFEQQQLFETGRTAQLKVSLRPETLPTPAASISRTTGSSVAMADPPRGATESVGPPPPGLAPTPDSSVSARTIMLIGSGGIAAVSLGLWIGFAAKGHSLASEEENLRAQLATTQPMPSGSCVGGGAACAELQDTADRRASANRTAFVAGIASGVSAAAFGATLLFWRKGPARPDVTTVIPAFAPGHAGLVLRGAF